MNRDRTTAVPEDLTGQPRRVPVGSGLRHTFRALRHRNYRLFFYGQLVSLIGTWMQQAALSWLVYQMTGSKFLLGVVAAAGSAPMMLFSMWGGSLADRHPKRTILLLTQTGSMLLAFALALAVWLGKAEPWLILLIAAGNGAAMGFDMPARQSFLTELTSREDLLNAVSLNSSIVNGARVVGPAVAGLALGHLGAAACFFLNGLSFLAVIAGLWRMRVSHHPAPAHAARRGARRRRAGATPGTMCACGRFSRSSPWSAFSGWSYSVLMPAFARDILGLGPDGYGALMAASWPRRAFRRVVCRCIWRARAGAHRGAGRCLAFCRGAGGVRLHPALRARAGLFVALGAGPRSFSHGKYDTPDHRARRNAGPGDGAYGRSSSER